MLGEVDTGEGFVVLAGDPLGRRAPRRPQQRSFRARHGPTGVRPRPLHRHEYQQRHQLDRIRQTRLPARSTLYASPAQQTSLAGRSSPRRSRNSLRRETYEPSRSSPLAPAAFEKRGNLIGGDEGRVLTKISHEPVRPTVRPQHRVVQFDQADASAQLRAAALPELSPGRHATCHRQRGGGAVVTGSSTAALSGLQGGSVRSIDSVGLSSAFLPER